jgi:hypothetical protein
MRLVNSYHPENQHLSCGGGGGEKVQDTTGDFFLNLVGYLHDSEKSNENGQYKSSQCE